MLRAIDHNTAPATPAAAVRACRAPRLVGITITRARARARAAGCELRIARSRGGSRVTQPSVQTVARQLPLPGSATQAPAGTVTVWANPVCFRTGLPGPPPNEPIVTPGPTRLVSGLFLQGGPLVIFSTPHCASGPGKSSAGTITVDDAGDGHQIASMTVAAGALASFDLAPGRYTIIGTFANATMNSQPIQTQPKTVTVRAGNTVRQDVVVYVP